ncbi:TetR/AcrR family transcriptional regulator [Arthrobacter sp. NtRootA1]|uniref:TetR/AcrR family transcriptional regulator n=1 Tax=Arthrobacter sp. NtRootA1 TaxID=2830983 RepID=UPI001CC6A10C|nr:TetR/AcrR family transcriptional regulator [Arthrobacter sp. NtRootA1]BCW05688.1 TetR family transcriptional regulator [Arthrobacter sp. NtRootA1]
MATTKQQSGTGQAKARGPYANGQQRRDEFVSRAFEVFATQGFQRLSLRKIAEELGVSHAALSYHFPSKEDLLQAVFERQSEHDRPILEKALAERGLLDLLPELVRENEAIPGLIQLDATMQAEGIRPDHPAHAFTLQRINQFNSDIQRELERERDMGRIRPDLNLEITARQLTAMLRGLQVQWLYDPTIDMAAHVTEFQALLRP